MRDLVGNDVPSRLGLGEDQTPAVADPAAAAAAPPAGARIADAYRNGAEPRCPGERRGFRRQPVERHPPEEQLDSPGKAVAGPAADQLSADQAGNSRAVSGPAQLDILSIHPHDGSGNERLGRKHSAELLYNPVLLRCGPGERRGRPNPPRVRYLQKPFPLVQAEPDSPSASDCAQEHRNRQVGMGCEPPRAHARPCGTRAPRRRLR